MIHERHLGIMYNYDHSSTLKNVHTISSDYRNNDKTRGDHFFDDL